MKNKFLSYSIPFFICAFSAVNFNTSAIEAAVHESTGGSVQTLSNGNFNDFISHGIVVVDFTATWCGPCKTLAPIFHELAGELGDQVAFGKLDVDSASQISKQSSIKTVPTLILYKDGKEIKRRGPGSKSEISSWIKSAL